LVAAAMEFFGTHHDFVVIWRREAIEGGARLEISMAEHMRPFLDRAVAFLEREVADGRLRQHDPAELMQTVYGAVSTYFSDAGFRARLSGIDPLTPESRERFRESLTAMLRDALAPR
jgi:hypothetical protein